MLRRCGLCLRVSLAICRPPTPQFGAAAAVQHAVAQDVGNDLAVPRQQRLGRTHLGADRQLAFGQTVAAVFLELFLRAVGRGAAGAEGAFVHLAAQAEFAVGRKLRRAEGASVGTIAATDAHVLVVQHHAFRGAIETTHRTHRHARRVRAVHAGHRDGLLAGYAFVHGDHAAAVHAPGHLVLVFAGGDAAVAVDATLGVTDEFHAGHGDCLR